MSVIGLATAGASAASGRVYGNVSNNGIPLEGATVSIPAVGWDTTLYNGTYQINNVPAGSSYRLNVDYHGKTFSKTILLNSGEDRMVDFELLDMELKEPTSTIRGVVWIDGVPAVGVPVFISPSTETTTDFAGRYVSSARSGSRVNVSTIIMFDGIVLKQEKTVVMPGTGKAISVDLTLSRNATATPEAIPEANRLPAANASGEILGSSTGTVNQSAGDASALGNEAPLLTTIAAVLGAVTLLLRKKN